MQRANKKPKKSFMLEGNIGAGKSTMLQLLQERCDVDIVFEPTDKWQKIKDAGNLLDLFYKDISRWAYTFQTYAFISRIQAQQKQERKEGAKNSYVVERSVYCDRYCFAKNCFELGGMTKLEWEAYKEWFEWLVEEYITKPHGFIYLQASPEVCFDRLVKRDRSEEASVPISYLKGIHEKHENWLINKKGIDSFLYDVPVLVLECNDDFENNLEIQGRHIEAIKKFMHSID